MKVLVNKIKYNEEDRLRHTSGKNVDDLKKSMEEIGLIEPIIINEYYKLIAGERRLKAAKELGWTHIEANQIKGLNRVGELKVEIHENWKRQDFTPKELADALATLKEAYEEEHPETVKGATLTPGQTVGVKKEDHEYRKTNLPNRESSETESEPEIEPAERFTKSAAELLGVSETTIKRHLQAKDAIEKGEVEDEEMKKDWDKGEIKPYKVLQHIRKVKKEKENVKKSEAVKELERRRLLAKELAEKGEEVEGIDYPPVDEDLTENEVDDIFNAVNEVREELKIEPIILCKNCGDSRIIECPYCKKAFLMCEKDFAILDIDKEACKDFK